MQPPSARPQDYYKGKVHINVSNKPLVLPLLPPRYIFMVTSSVMQMFTVRGLFMGLPSEDTHSHIEKLRFVCKSCVGRPDLDMNVIRL